MFAFRAVKMGYYREQVMNKNKKGHLPEINLANDLLCYTGERGRCRSTLAMLRCVDSVNADDSATNGKYGYGSRPTIKSKVETCISNDIWDKVCDRN